MLLRKLQLNLSEMIYKSHQNHAVLPKFFQSFRGNTIKKHTDRERN